MSYRRELFIKDPRLQRYFDELMLKKVVEMPTKISHEVSRYKTIQRLRDIDRKDPILLISRDDKTHISIMKMRRTLTLKKDGNKYYFEL